MKHLLSFDIEHWYESWRMRHLGGWRGLPDCDTAIVYKILDLLDTYRHSATFFFTGAFAREFPEIAQECVHRGHEVGSHTDSHMYLPEFGSNMGMLQRDIELSVESIAKATGVQPVGFRAPKWSIFPDLAEDVLGVLIALGMRYDSSFFPGHFNYKVAQNPHRIILGQRSIVEVPATALQVGSMAIPVGGAYFRLEPVWMLQSMFAQRATRGVPGLFYAHPYDLNPSCHCPLGTPLKLRLMRKLGVNGALKKLERILASVSFMRIDKWVDIQQNLEHHSFE